MHHLDPNVTPEQIAEQYPFDPEVFIDPNQAKITVTDLIAAVKWLTAEGKLAALVNEQHCRSLQEGSGPGVFTAYGQPYVPPIEDFPQDIDLPRVLMPMAVVDTIRGCLPELLGEDYLAHSSPPVIFYNREAVNQLADHGIYLLQITGTIATEPYVQIFLDTGVFYI